jgi:uracil-DNA glycosylase
MQLPTSWKPVVGDELTKPYFQELRRFLVAERAADEVYPADEQIFNSLEHTPFSAVKVVILGQDPYHDKGQAHGLAFSVAPGIKPPPSLLNIFKEMADDLGVPHSASGCLIPWAKQGVLLLNTVLTVRAHQPHSHRNKGWEVFTDSILRKLNARADPVVFVLWGAPAKKKKGLIDQPRHAMLEAAHPSPLSAYQGFFGSHPFSKINRTLTSWGKREIDWRVTENDTSTKLQASNHK